MPRLGWMRFVVYCRGSERISTPGLNIKICSARQLHKFECLLFTSRYNTVLHPIRPCLGDFEAQSVPKISIGPNHCLFTLVRQLEIEFDRDFRLCAPQYIAVHPSLDVQHVRHYVINRLDGTFSGSVSDCRDSQRIKADAFPLVCCEI